MVPRTTEKTVTMEAMVTLLIADSTRGERLVPDTWSATSWPSAV